MHRGGTHNKRLTPSVALPAIAPRPHFASRPLVPPGLRVWRAPEVVGTIAPPQGSPRQTNQRAPLPFARSRERNRGPIVTLAEVVLGELARQSLEAHHHRGGVRTQLGNQLVDSCLPGSRPGPCPPQDLDRASPRRPAPPTPAPRHGMAPPCSVARSWVGFSPGDYQRARPRVRQRCAVRSVPTPLRGVRPRLGRGRQRAGFGPDVVLYPNAPFIPSSPPTPTRQPLLFHPQSRLTPSLLLQTGQNFWNSQLPMPSAVASDSHLVTYLGERMYAVARKAERLFQVRPRRTCSGTLSSAQTALSASSEDCGAGVMMHAETPATSPTNGDMHGPRRTARSRGPSAAGPSPSIQAWHVAPASQTVFAEIPSAGRAPSRGPRPVARMAVLSTPDRPFVASPFRAPTGQRWLEAKDRHRARGDAGGQRSGGRPPYRSFL